MLPFGRSYNCIRLSTKTKDNIFNVFLISFISSHREQERNCLVWFFVVVWGVVNGVFVVVVVFVIFSATVHICFSGIQEWGNF